MGISKVPFIEQFSDIVSPFTLPFTVVPIEIILTCELLAVETKLPLLVLLKVIFTFAVNFPTNFGTVIVIGNSYKSLSHLIESLESLIVNF